MDINIDILPSPCDTNCIWYEANIVLTKACILPKLWMTGVNKCLAVDAFVNELYQHACRADSTVCPLGFKLTYTYI